MKMTVQKVQQGKNMILTKIGIVQGVFFNSSYSRNGLGSAYSSRSSGELSWVSFFLPSVNSWTRGQQWWPLTLCIMYKVLLVLHVYTHFLPCHGDLVVVCDIMNPRFFCLVEVFITLSSVEAWECTVCYISAWMMRLPHATTQTTPTPTLLDVLALTVWVLASPWWYIYGLGNITYCIWCLVTCNLRPPPHPHHPPPQKKKKKFSI